MTLAGWVDRRRDHGGVAFVDLRDSSGLVQVVINDEEMARPLRSEFVVRVIGAVRLRPEGNENEHLATGKVEVVARSIEILAKSDALPFQVSTALENESENKLPGEDVRLKYRYLDFAPSVHAAQHQAALRHGQGRPPGPRRDGLHRGRDPDDDQVHARGRPRLPRARPSGARLLVRAAAVPAAAQAAADGLRRRALLPDRPLLPTTRTSAPTASPSSPSSTWRWAFVDQEDVIAMAEKVIAAIWKAAGYEVKLPIQRITWQEAMDKYGTDKPDLLFGNELIELHRLLQGHAVPRVPGPICGCRALQGRAPPRRVASSTPWQDWAKQRGAKGLAYVVFAEDGELKGPVAKNLSEAERAGLKEAVGAEDGDAVFFAAGPRTSSQNLLGAVRVELADPRRPAQARRLRLHLGGGLPAVQVHRGRG